MPLVQQLGQYPGKECQGVYRLLDPQCRTSRAGNTYFRGVLRDCSGEIRVYGWLPEFQHVAFKHNHPIQCTVKPRWHQQALVVDLVRCEQSEWIFGHPFSLIDLEQLPQPDLAAKLLRFIGGCQVPALRDFLMVLFNDETRLIDFLTLPASDDYHHARPGGLAEHSLEVAARIRADQSLDQQEERWLAEVAGLVHDIGKLKTMPSQGKRPPMQYALDHTQLTLEVLAPALAVLDTNWPEGAAALRYLLTWQSRTPQGRPMLPGALTLTYADQISASTDARRRVFQHRPGRQHFARFNGRGPRTTFWRLSDTVGQARTGSPTLSLPGV